jgi:hypothetical protein
MQSYKLSKLVMSRPGVLKDVSLWVLVSSNLAFAIFFIMQGGEFGTLMWAYWAQSVIIGVFNFIRILTQKNFSVKSVKLNNRPAKHNIGTKNYIAFFFLFHYGFFHFAYLMFLKDMAETTQIDFILIGALIFLINHGFSLLYNHSKERYIEKNLGTMMFFPYIRIFPMHLTIIFGGFIQGIFSDSMFASILVIILFLGLKTIADAVSHVIEHNKFLGLRVPK